MLNFYKRTQLKKLIRKLSCNSPLTWEVDGKELDEVKKVLKASRELTESFRGYNAVGYDELKEKLLSQALPSLIEAERKVATKVKNSGKAYLVLVLPLLWEELGIVLTQVEKFPEANVYLSAFLEASRKLPDPQVREEWIHNAYALFGNLSLAVNDVESFKKFFALLYGDKEEEKLNRFLSCLNEKKKLYTVREETELVPFSFPLYVKLTKTPEEVVADELRVSVKLLTNIN